MPLCCTRGAVTAYANGRMPAEDRGVGSVEFPMGSAAGAEVRPCFAPLEPMRACHQSSPVAVQGVGMVIVWRMRIPRAQGQRLVSMSPGLALLRFTPERMVLDHRR